MDFRRCNRIKGDEIFLVMSLKQLRTQGLESVWGYLNPINIIFDLWLKRGLISQFVKRDVLSRYKGSYLGIFWSFLYPLLMLSVYTFVFSVIFKAKWGISMTESKVEFALTLFCGIIAFNIFSETVNQAPRLILNNPNFVKKVIFPLEILPIVSIGSALIHSFISLIILLVGVAIFMHTLSWTIAYIPIVIFPLILMTLGISWFLASIGVFVRDIGYAIGIVTQILFFLTPVFYPISVVPKAFQTIMRLNPLSVIVEDFRRVVIWGMQPDWPWLGLVTIISLLIAVSGYIWFNKCKKVFADVI